MAPAIPEPIDKIPAEAEAAFEAEMKRREVDLERYDREYLADDDHFIVMTVYKDKPKGLRGSVPGFPDYEVTIQKEDWKVTDVSIAR
ncbi:MAG: hypothetical protein AAGA03_12635 [Planctomycetota bacterium]